jgi:hypothetical protein
VKREGAEAAVRRALWRVRNSSRRVMLERVRNFAEQGYQGEDLLRRAAGIPLVRECSHADQSGPYCGLCGGLAA